MYPVLTSFAIFLKLHCICSIKHACQKKFKKATFLLVHFKPSKGCLGLHFVVGKEAKKVSQKRIVFNKSLRVIHVTLLPTPSVGILVGLQGGP